MLEVDENIKMSDSFDDMNLKTEILKGIYTCGYEKPSPCQKIIPSLIDGLRDSIITSAAGSGKTIIFSITALQNVDETLNKPQVILISPTRELAIQTYNVITTLASFTNISIALHRGTGKMTRQENVKHVSHEKSDVTSGYKTFGECENGNEQIIVATPGRLLDIITRENIRINDIRMKKINTGYIKMIVLDEADELLSESNNFQETLSDIFDKIPTINFCQKIVISATMTEKVLNICDKILANPLKILIKKENLILAGIQQYYVRLPTEEDKIECLLDIYSNISISTSIIFTNEKKKAEYIFQRMEKEKFSVAFIHSTMEQKTRDSIMQDFRLGKLRVLIATDLLARGIDVQTISTVFNYDLPNDKENYIHRIGRSGRYGRKGIAINFVVGNTNTRSNVKPTQIRDIETFYSFNIDSLPALDKISWN
jgi:hypothetical protein